ncbi:type IIL restriction-modification enzyme MmeI, partial [Streptococcus suis]
SKSTVNSKRIFINDEQFEIVENISPYLISGKTIFVESQKKPLANVSPMYFGSKPTDGGFFFLTPNERNEFIKKEPQSARFIHKV